MPSFIDLYFYKYVIYLGGLRYTNYAYTGFSSLYEPADCNALAYSIYLDKIISYCYVCIYNAYVYNLSLFKMKHLNLQNSTLLRI